MVLNRKEIQQYIKEQGLITDYFNLDLQLTPNGFDLTVAKLFVFDNKGVLDFSNKQRIIPEAKEISPLKQNAEDKFGWWELKKGAYKIITNEVINLPNDLIGLAFSRTSLLRMGSFTQHGIWDAGFRGKSEFILCVENPKGIRIKQNSRVAQIIFIKINHIDKGYSGIYQNKT